MYAIARNSPSEFNRDNYVKLSFFNKVASNGTVIYNQLQSSYIVGVQALQEGTRGETIEAIRSTVTIENANAPKEYEFAFELPEGYMLVTNDDYEKNYVTEEERDFYENNELGNLIYIINPEGMIINTIDEPWAVDAIGNSVETRYEIKDNILIQFVEFDESSNFPIVADPTSYPAKWKYNYAYIPRGNAIVASNAIKRINEVQNSTLSRFITLMTTLVGLWPTANIAVSYTATVISGVQGGVLADLDRQKAIYTDIVSVYAVNVNPQKQVTRARITYPLYGTWKGNSRGYMYQQRAEYVKYFSATGAEIEI